jgi:hypothetical protein
MRAVGAACAELADTLRAAGHRADVDPERLVTDPGCIWISPREVRDYTLAGGGTLVVWLYLIVANVEPSHAMTLLDDALDSVLGLDGVTPSATDAVIDLASAVALPGTEPLPAYRLVVDLDL